MGFLVVNCKDDEQDNGQIEEKNKVPVEKGAK
jgi:hypothetical protein